MNAARCFACVTIVVSCVCAACENGGVAYTLKYPEIKPSVVPPDNTVEVNLPKLDGDYQIMEIIIENTGGVFPVTVLIYDEEDNEVYSVRDVVGLEKRRRVLKRSGVGMCT